MRGARCCGVSARGFGKQHFTLDDKLDDKLTTEADDVAFDILIGHPHGKYQKYQNLGFTTRFDIRDQRLEDIFSQARARVNCIRSVDTHTTDSSPW